MIQGVNEITLCIPIFNPEWQNIMVNFNQQTTNVSPINCFSNNNDG